MEDAPKKATAEQRKEYMRKWREANKDKMKHYFRDYYQDNKEELNEKHKQYNKDTRARQRELRKKKKEKENEAKRVQEILEDPLFEKYIKPKLIDIVAETLGKSILV